MRFGWSRKEVQPSAHFHVGSNSDLEALAPLVLKTSREGISTYLHLGRYLPTHESEMMLLDFLDPYLKSTCKHQHGTPQIASTFRIQHLGLRFNLEPRIRLRHSRGSLHVFGPTSLSLVEFAIAKLRGAVTVSMPHGFAFYKDDQFLGFQAEDMQSPAELPNFASRNRFDAIGVENLGQRNRMLRWGIRPTKLSIVGLPSLDPSWIDIRDTLWCQRIQGCDSSPELGEAKLILNWPRESYSSEVSLESRLDLLSKLSDKMRVLVSIHPTDPSRALLRHHIGLNTKAEILEDSADTFFELSRCQVLVSASSTLVAQALARGIPIIYLEFLDRGPSELSSCPRVEKFSRPEEFLRFMQDEAFVGGLAEPTKANSNSKRLSSFEGTVESAWRFLARTYEAATSTTLKLDTNFSRTNAP